MSALAPGIYLVGCEDGSVYPIIVRLKASGAGMVAEGNGMGTTAARLAWANRGFWWRRMVVPGVMPEPPSVAEPPNVRRLPGDI